MLFLILLEFDIRSDIRGIPKAVMETYFLLQISTNKAVQMGERRQLLLNMSIYYIYKQNESVSKV